MRKRKPSGKHNPQTITLKRVVYTDIPRKDVKKDWDFSIKYCLEQFPEDKALYRSMSFETFLDKYFTSQEWDATGYTTVREFFDVVFGDYCDDVYDAANKVTR
jgi:hypothetical protein